MDARATLLRYGPQYGECLDDFGDRTSPSMTGRAPTGQDYIQLPNPAAASGCGVLLGKAYTSASAAQRILVDTGISDGAVQITFDTLGAASTMLMLARVSLALNNVQCNELEVRADATSWKLFRRTTNAVTTLLNIVQTPAAGDVARLAMHGAALELFVNGVSIGTATDGQNMGSGLHGWIISTDTTARFDGFRVLRAA